MKRKNWAVAAAVAIVGLVLGSIGCDDDDDNKNDGGTYSFSIAYESGFFDYGGWSVVQSADGGTVLGARAPDPESTIVYDSLATNRVTYTNINTLDANQRDYWIVSFQGVDIEDWTFGSDLNPPVIGQAEVTFEFEPQDTTRKLYMQVSGGGPESFVIAEIPAGTSQWQSTLSVCRTESDGSVTILGRLFDRNTDLPMYAGYLYEQDFVLGEVNNYHITLNAEIERPVVSFSQPIESVQAACTREPFYHKYQLYDWYGDATSDVTIEIPGGFPVLEYQITAGAYLYSEGAYFYMTNDYSEIPQTVQVPTTTFDVNYNSEAQVVNDINISGETDLITAWWRGYGIGPNGNTDVVWFVWCDAAVASIQPPVLPDSIMQEMGLEMSDLYLSGVEITNCDGYAGIRGFAHEMFADDTPDYYDCDHYYTLSKYVTRADEEISFEEIRKASPLGQRTKRNN